MTATRTPSQIAAADQIAAGLEHAREFAARQPALVEYADQITEGHAAVFLSAAETRAVIRALAVDASARARQADDWPGVLALLDLADRIKAAHETGAAGPLIDQRTRSEQRADSARVLDELRRD